MGRMKEEFMQMKMQEQEQLEQECLKRLQRELEEKEQLEQDRLKKLQRDREEKERLENTKNSVIYGFDSFEKFLYTSSSADGLTYPKENETGSLLNATSSEALGWYDSALSSATEYDYYNTSNLVNNLPQHIQTDEEGQEFTLFFNMIGQHFDILWVYTKSLAEAKKLGIPVMAILDSNCNPDITDIPIPGNDDAIRSIKLIVGKIADSICEGQSGKVQNEGKEEVEFA